MVIFHSYVKLPEGNQSLSFTPNKLPHLVAWRGTQELFLWAMTNLGFICVYIYIFTMSPPLDR